MTITKGKIYRDTRTKEVGTVIEVVSNPECYKVRFDVYEDSLTISYGTAEFLEELKGEELADYYLKMENSGVSDFWRY